MNASLRTGREEPIVSYGGPTPQSYEAEQALLGALLTNNAVYNLVVGLVREEDFADPVHGRIFTAICRLIERAQLANVVTLANMFQQDVALAEVGGAAYLARLANSVVTLINSDDYARTIRDLADRRRAIEACLTAIEDLTKVDLEKPAAEITADLSDKLIEGIGADDGMITMAQVAERVVLKLNEDLPCYSTGLECMDSIIGGGLYAHKFYGIAADHKIGKSLLMATIAYNLAMAGIPVLYIGLEMHPDEMTQRILARMMGVNSLGFLDQKMRKEQWFQEAAGEAQVALSARNNLILVQRSYMDISDMSATIARAAVRRKIRGVFLDYVQLVDGQQRGDSLATHYDKVTRRLEQIKNRYPIFIMAAAQTNREGGIRQGDGLLKACDMALRLHKVEVISAPDRAWLEMMASRFTRRYNIGSQDQPALEMVTKAGPYFAEVGHDVPNAEEPQQQLGGL